VATLPVVVAILPLVVVSLPVLAVMDSSLLSTSSSSVAKYATVSANVEKPLLAAISRSLLYTASDTDKDLNLSPPILPPLRVFYHYHGYKPREKLRRVFKLTEFY
jgi:nitrogen fixation/metabolism regulation signal transduction histidine kinase